MHLIALALLALLGGFAFNFLNTNVFPKLPDQFKNNKILTPLTVGGMILVSIFAARFVLGFFGRKMAV